MLHYEAKTKRPTYQYNTHFIEKKETAICFTFVVICLFKYALLYNLIRLVSILRKYAAGEQKRF